jgi:site-specific DNA-cytosine methylase
MPTHSDSPEYGLPPWRTVRDAIAQLPPQSDHLTFPESRLKYYRMLNEGQYWRHLPAELHKEAMGASYFAGGGKTGFYRRLAWDKPSCTLVTHPAMPATDICHPVHDRPLSVTEYTFLRGRSSSDGWPQADGRSSRTRRINARFGLAMISSSTSPATRNGASSPFLQPASCGLDEPTKPMERTL